MKIECKENDPGIVKETTSHADHTSEDGDADKSGTDTSSDSTEKRKGPMKYDKPKRETDPDRTGIDVNADKTKTEES